MAEFSKAEILRSLYEDNALPQDKMALIKSLEDEGQLDQALEALSKNQQFIQSLGGGTAQQKVSLERKSPEYYQQKSEQFEAEKPNFLKETVGSIAQQARPYLQGAGATVGAVIGAGSGLLTGPGAPVASPAGALAGGGLGFALGDEIVDMLEHWAGTKEQKPIVVELTEAGKNVLEGAAYEAGGQAIAPAMGAMVKAAMKVPAIEYGVIAGKEMLGKVPKITEEGVKKVAGKLLHANTSKGPIIAKNIETAKAIEEQIPGLKFTYGELTGDPGIIKLEKSIMGEKGTFAQDFIERQKLNDEAIQKSLIEKRPQGSISDVIETFGGKQAEIEGVEKAAGEALSRETEQLGMGAGQLEAGQTIRAEATAGKAAAKKEGKKLYKEIPQYDLKTIDASQLADDIESVSKPMNRFESVEKNVPWEQINKIKEVLSEDQNIVSLKDLDGLQSQLKKEIRKAKSPQASGVEINEQKISRLVQINNKVEELIKKIAEDVTPASIEPKWHNLGSSERLSYYDPKKITEEGNFKVWDHDEGKYFKFKNKEDFKKWVEDYPWANITEPVGEIKTYYRYGKPPNTNRSWNAAEQKPEVGVSVYETPEGSGGAGFFSDRKIYQGKGRQVGWGADGEPVIIPEGKWEQFTPEKKVPFIGSSELKKARTFWKQEVIDKFKKGDVGEILANKGGGEYRVSDAQIASKFFKQGPSGKQSAQQFKNAIGGSKKAMQAIEDAAKQDLLSKFPGEEITESGLRRWLNRNKLALDELGLTNKFDSIKKAREQLTDAVSFRKYFEKSEAAKLLGSDPDIAVKKALGEVNVGKAATNLMKMTGGNKTAQAGLRNSLEDFILDQSKNLETGMITKVDTLDKLTKKYRPALNVFYHENKEVLKNWDTVRNAFRIAQKSRKIPGFTGSETQPLLLTSLMKAIDIRSGRIGTIVKIIMDPLSRSEATKVNSLIKQALLNPDYAYTLMLAADTVQPGLLKGTIPKAQIIGRETFKKTGKLPDYISKRLKDHLNVIKTAMTQERGKLQQAAIAAGAAQEEPAQ